MPEYPFSYLNKGCSRNQDDLRNWDDTKFSFGLMKLHLCTCKILMGKYEIFIFSIIKPAISLGVYVATTRTSDIYKLKTNIT
jgi:hypothetical protein